MDTRGFGLPHRRRRILIVASAHGDPRDVLLAQTTHCRGLCAELFGAACCRCAVNVRPRANHFSNLNLKPQPYPQAYLTRNLECEPYNTYTYTFCWRPSG